MMIIFQLFLIGAGLSMDALAVSVGDGLSFKKMRLGGALAIAAAFGIFQAGMPLLGYFLGSMFIEIIAGVDHYIAFALLAFIGGQMLVSGIRGLGGKEKAAETVAEAELSFPKLMLQAVATSIDALVVGVSFVAMGLTAFETAVGVITIGVTTFALSLAGVYLGRKFGVLLGAKAELIGGVILIAIGAKVLIEHLFFA